MTDQYVARDDACIAIGIAVLDLFANGSETVIVTRDDGEGFFCTEE